MLEELTVIVEELKKSKVLDSISSLREEDKDEREYMDPMPSPDLTTSPDISNQGLKVEFQLPQRLDYYKSKNCLSLGQTLSSLSLTRLHQHKPQ